MLKAPSLQKRYPRVPESNGSILLRLSIVWIFLPDLAGSFRQRTNIVHARAIKRILFALYILYSQGNAPRSYHL